MEDYILRIIILGIISWTTAFHLFRKLLPKRSFEFCNRLVSTAHATSAVVLASLSVENWACPVSPLASKSSPSQMQALAVSLSYLIYDLICCQFDKRVSIDNTIHHLVSIVGMAAGLVYRKSGSEMIAALFITEISSPFLHLRELLKELGYRDTDLNLAADISFAAIFSFARMVVGPYIAWLTLTADNPLIIKAMALGLQLVSAYWFYKIARMLSFKLTKRAASKNLACADKGASAANELAKLIPVTVKGCVVIFHLSGPVLSTSNKSSSELKIKFRIIYPWDLLITHELRKLITILPL